MYIKENTGRLCVMVETAARIVGECGRVLYGVVACAVVSYDGSCMVYLGFLQYKNRWLMSMNIHF